jgi:hypothetical protein
MRFKILKWKRLLTPVSIFMNTSKGEKGGGGEEEEEEEVMLVEVLVGMEKDSMRVLLRRENGPRH